MGRDQVRRDPPGPFADELGEAGQEGRPAEVAGARQDRPVVERPEPGVGPPGGPEQRGEADDRLLVGVPEQAGRGRGVARRPWCLAEREEVGRAGPESALGGDLAGDRPARGRREGGGGSLPRSRSEVLPKPEDPGAGRRRAEGVDPAARFEARLWRTADSCQSGIIAAGRGIRPRLGVRPRPGFSKSLGGVAGSRPGPFGPPCPPSPLFDGPARMSDPMNRLAGSLRRSSIVRFLDHFAQLYPDDHLKDLVVDELGPGRWMRVNGRRVMNFGSDSFLGLDQDPRVRDALERGVRTWGTHNGASRAFASVRANAQAEDRLAQWLGTEAVLIYPSVTLANLGAIPALMARNDVLVLDAQAHNSVQEGAKVAAANGAKVSTFANSDPIDLDRALAAAGPSRASMVAVDGVFSMSGSVAPLAALDEVARRHGAVLYVDDAHGTGTLGSRGGAGDRPRRAGEL